MQDLDAPKYSYVTLQPGFFRLFKLLTRAASSYDGSPLGQAAGAANNATLEGEFVESPFQNPIVYEALSYCWTGHERALSPEERGKRSTLDRPILVREGAKVVGVLLISAVLEGILLQLRTHTDKPLFVDQLCINQANNAEKGHLVRHMGEIYSKAKQVLAWLGPSTLEADRLVSFMMHLEEDAKPAYLRLCDHDYPTLDALRLSVAAPNPESKPVPSNLIQDRDVLREAVMAMQDDMALRGFMDICSRQLFGRMWIVQEACLSGTLHFVCGHNAWHVDQFERVLLLFTMFLAYRAGNLTAEDVGKDFPKVDDIISAIGLCRFVNRVFSTRRTIHGQGQTRMPMFHLLTKFNVADTGTPLTEEQDLQKFRAGNPRDCLYSLLALPDENDTIMERVEVSYEKSVQNIFTQLAEAIARDYPDVLLFSQNHSKQFKDLPSWVPDWTSQLLCPFGYGQSSKPLFTAGYARGSPIWEGSTESYVVDSSLVITGTLIDTISKVGEHVYETPVSPHHKPTEVSHHYFLSEVEYFCRLARKRQAEDPDESPPCLGDAPWLIASGGRGLASSPQASQDELLGPEIQGVRLLDAAYQIWRHYLERHTKKHELLGWQGRRAEVLRPLEEQWLEMKKRTGLFQAIAYWLGLGAGWDAYEFCEKFNQHWDKFGPVMGTERNAEEEDGRNLAAEVRDEAAVVSGRLGKAMDIQQGRKCFCL
ncbi:uncharacterized protein J7T54_005102 [Emericellopsis cladophorae]|uniref:Heterokaryon incompatibility domain-containing protein n=1 Tax=Emericellopsis cladophorae TaxID=2686198 RepID=A0A9Q0BDH6_9HYPO|nr:uncharacterized protein J7T54_005102 [Emericellopsis cladophorae]KAI6781892.1 hypothetical protein J7T54_005102 [Emericellopsis cladophorae]